MNLLNKKSGEGVDTMILEQIKDVEACLSEFTRFMEAAVNPETDADTLRTMATKVSRKEEAADVSLRKMSDSLNASLLPATRSELVKIATSCDEIANKCQHTALMMVFQGFRFPESYAKDLMKMMDLMGKQMPLLMTAISRLFSDFGGLLKDHSILDEIRDFETDVDDIEEKLIERSYASDLGLAEKMQMANFVDAVADISDIIEDVADAIQISLIIRKA